MTGVIGPHTRAHALLFYAVNEIVKVVPPKLVVANNDIVVLLLIFVNFLVHSQMQKLRLEQVAHFFYNIHAYLIVGLPLFNIDSGVSLV